MSDYFILPDGRKVNNDNFSTNINGNVAVFGSSGAGKTRSVVAPNLLECNGSYIVVDMKGSLFKQYCEYFYYHDYVVKRLSFSNPIKSHKYNPLAYLKTTRDIEKLTHSIIYSSKPSHDPYWDNNSISLLNGVIYETLHNEDNPNLNDVIDNLRFKGAMSYSPHREDMYIDKDDWGSKQLLSVMYTPEKTYSCIISNTLSKLSLYATEEVSGLLEKDEMHLHKLYERKTIIFVEVSDIDKSLNGLANLFINQAMLILQEDANNFDNNRLPLPIHFILDDFGVNLKIQDFDMYIPNIRSKNINAIILTQAKSQLASAYDKSIANTILANCDTQLFLGGLDEETCSYFSKLFDYPIQKVWKMPIGRALIFRRGYIEEEVNVLNLDKYMENNNIKLPPEPTDIDKYFLQLEE